MRRVGRRRWCARSALPRNGGRGGGNINKPSGAARRNAKRRPEAMVRPKRPPPSWGQGGNQKRRDRKPVSVFESAIYLRNLPPDIGRAALICQYIWFCRPWCRTRNTSLHCAVGSYPTFSPSLPGRPGGSHSLLRLAKDYSHLRFPQQGALSCPDFPHLTCDRRGRSSRLEEYAKL